MSFIGRMCNKLLRDIISLMAPILPINKNRAYFSSFAGRFSDSPKQIALRMKELHPTLEIDYLVLKGCKELPDCFVRSERGSWKDAWNRATAHVIVDNNYGKHEVWLKDNSKKARKRFEVEINRIRRKEQFVYTTWHGTPLKKMGIDTPNSSIIDFDCPNTRMFLGNGFTAQVMNRLMFQKVPIEMMGTPRNDPLFITDKEEICNTKKKLRIPENKKVLLFAPTFRDANGEGSEPNIDKSGISQLKQMSFSALKETLSSRFGGEWVVILRFHYFVDKQVDWEKLRRENDGSVINGNAYDDMMEYLQVTDILLSDASSCMFDFALTSKPCFRFFPDIDDYSNERGLYFSFNELPFPAATDFNDLLNIIQQFNPEQYDIERKKFLLKIGNIDNGMATDKVCNYILNRHFMS